MPKVRVLYHKRTLNHRRGVPVERDIATLLRRLTNGPFTFKETRSEPIWSYSEFQVQEAILNLLKKGLIETVYPCKFELGFRPSGQTS